MYHGFLYSRIPRSRIAAVNEQGTKMGVDFPVMLMFRFKPDSLAVFIEGIDKLAVLDQCIAQFLVNLSIVRILRQGCTVF